MKSRSSFVSSRQVPAAYLIGNEVVDLLEIDDTTVVVVLAWEEGAREVGWVRVR